MILGGFIAAAAAVVVMLLCFLTNTNVVTDLIDKGFGLWLDYFFAIITPQKVVFFIAAAVLVIGVICYISAQLKAKKAGEETTFVPTGVSKYFRDTKGEFKKIVWPTLPAVVRNTGITLIVCILLGAVICLFDLGLSALVNLMLNIGG